MLIAAPRLVVVLLVFFLSWHPSTSPVRALTNVAEGDVDGDTLLTSADALLAMQHFVELTVLNEEAQTQANVPAANTDAITPADVLCIFRRFLGQPSCLDPPLAPAGEDQFLSLSDSGVECSEIRLSGIQSTTSQPGGLMYHGNLDIVTANNGARVVNATRVSSVSVILSSGNGFFQTAQQFDVGEEATAVTVADLTADGNLDIVSASGRANTITVLEGNGTGTVATFATVGVDNGPQAVIVTGINHDGDPDVITANSLPGTITVLLGNGDGTFQEPQSFAAGALPISVAAGDLDSDGLLDLAVANQATNDNGVTVLLGDSDGTFQLAQFFVTGDAPAAVTIADLNGDAGLDIATTNRDDVSILLRQ